MRSTDRTSRAWTLAVLVLGGVLGLFPSVYGQGVEQEPNHPCPAAQAFGAVSLPFAVDGSLDSTPDSPDLDFLSFTGTPGAAVRVDLEGAATGSGTLPDPYLGFFDSTCQLVAANDDYQSLNSRLLLTVPADGIFILGATQCCDSEFLGGGLGTYRMTIAPL
jgi:hypothetical protein